MSVGRRASQKLNGLSFIVYTSVMTNVIGQTGQQYQVSRIPMCSAAILAFMFFVLHRVQQFWWGPRSFSLAF